MKQLDELVSHLHDKKAGIEQLQSVFANPPPLRFPFHAPGSQVTGRKGSDLQKSELLFLTSCKIENRIMIWHLKSR